MRKVFYIYSIVIGIGILLTWSILLISGLASKLYSGNGYLIIHVFGEYITAITLVMSGVFSIRDSKVFKRVNEVSAGMLIILTLHAFNSYLFVGDTIMAGLFFIITISTIILWMWTLQKVNSIQSPPKHE
jgi:hypothetical protein